jgi:hypothetical protein
MGNTYVVRLAALATLLSVGHHIDHIFRGNHVGWPLSGEVTPFTYSFGFYPIILLGFSLYRTNRIGPWFWAITAGPGALFVGLTHFGPFALEPASDIIPLYRSAVFGWAAFGWLITFVVVLIVLALYATYLEMTVQQSRKVRRKRPRDAQG